MIHYVVSWLVTSFINGLLFFALFAFFFYMFYFKNLPSQTPPSYSQYEKSKISEELKRMLNMGSLDPNFDSILVFNMIFHFLFQELKDSSAVRRYITRKLNIEFKEILTTKTAGKLVDRITIRDFSLGTNIPLLQSAFLQDYKLDESKNSIEEVTVFADIEYKNGFSISIDVDLILGRSAFVHIKVASIVGKVRLQFTKQPSTHWSFSFIDDPEISFDVSSQFDGKQIPQLTSLITNQLRRSIRKKYTLPNYKIRYKPFFTPMYDNTLYKSHVNDLLIKLLANSGNQDLSSKPIEADTVSLNNNSAAEANTPTTPAIDETDSNQNQVALIKQSSAIKKPINDAKRVNILYKHLCEKIGVDLASYGRLEVNLGELGHLPEALYSLNMNIINTSPNTLATTPESVNVPSSLPASASSSQMPKSASSNQLGQLGGDKDTCYVYLTVSLDNLSMKELMKRQITKEHWPMVEFELIKTNVVQNSYHPFGLNLIELFLINKVEVAVQKVLPVLAESGKDVKKFDIIHSVNQSRISSIKQLNKIIQKTPIGKSLRFVLQRPSIILTKPVQTSANLTSKKPEEVKKPDSSNQPETPQPPSSLNIIPTDSASTPTGATTPTASSSNLVSSTKSRLEQIKSFRLDPKRFSFGAGGGHSAPNATNNNNSHLTHSSSSGLLTAQSSSSDSFDASSPASAGPTSSPSASPLLPNKTFNQSSSVSSPAPTQITHTASSSNLVEFFCSVSECSLNEKLPTLDLITLLTRGEWLNKDLNDVYDSDNQSEEDSTAKQAELLKKRKESYFKKTREIKLDKENLFSINNFVKPILIDETYTFDLNKNTKFMNVFMWTVQYIPRQAKMKNLLLGYITIPLNELSVDCWSTAKGETRTDAYFKPLEELKATSVVSRVVRSHVISDHPGFDSSVSMGMVALKFQHQITNLTELRSEPSSDTTQSSAPSQPVSQELDVKEVTNHVGQHVAEKYLVESELTRKMNDGSLKSLEEKDDGSMHKFVTAQFNENVICAFCHKKIWFKNAYKCVYCGYIIHFKCYEKTIGKAICPRFFNKQLSSASADEQFVIIGAPPSDPLAIKPGEDSNSEVITITNTKGAVSNFFSGIRQRATKRFQDTDAVPASPIPPNIAVPPNKQPTAAATTSNPQNNKSGSLFNNLYSNLYKSKHKYGKPSPEGQADQQQPKNDRNDHIEASSSQLLDDSTNMDTFEDFDPNSEDRLFGVELFEELPVEERRVKFEETIQRYQSAIEMMSKLKLDLETELKNLNQSTNYSTSKLDSSSINRLKAKQQQELNLKSQIKHLNEQMKGVVFLLMQCQIGLENCNDMAAAKNETTKSVDQPISVLIDDSNSPSNIQNSMIESTESQLLYESERLVENSDESSSKSEKSSSSIPDISISTH